MTRILFVLDGIPIPRGHSEVLGNAGYTVEVAAEPLAARTRLAGRPCDVVVIDAERPDGGSGLLVGQTQAAWPDCAVLVLVQHADIGRTKVHEMGLWTPDCVLVKPVSDERLLKIVGALASERAAPAGEVACAGARP